MVIDISAQPMRVRKGIGRTRRYEKALGIEAAILECLIRVMTVIREAALQSTAQLREMLEPATVRCQLITILESVAQPEPLQRQIGKRSR